jgi:hypothetical protein
MGVEHARRILLPVETHTEPQSQLATTLWNADFISGLTSGLSYRFNEHESRPTIDDLWGSLNHEEPSPIMDVVVAAPIVTDALWGSLNHEEPSNVIDAAVAAPIVTVELCPTPTTMPGTNKHSLHRRKQIVHPKWFSEDRYRRPGSETTVLVKQIGACSADHNWNGARWPIGPYCIDDA